MTVEQQLEELVIKEVPIFEISEKCDIRNDPSGFALHVAKKAYELGKASKKCKEDVDNPYHIDHKRQTKLFD